MSKNLKFGWYADTVIGKDSEAYKYLEVNWVVANPDGSCEILDGDPEFWDRDADMYSVYARNFDGTCDCVGDFPTFPAAMDYAMEVTKQYGFEVPPIA